MAVDFLRKTKPVIFSSLPEEENGDIAFEDDRTENLPDAVIDQQETARLMKEILGSLSEAQRVAVIMFYYERMSLHEIAQTLQVSENTVKSRLLYARKKIETEVRALEKKGTKLYGLAPVPFLLWLFRNMDGQAAEIPGTLLQSVMGQIGSSVSAEGALPAGASTVAKTGHGCLKIRSQHRHKKCDYESGSRYRRRGCDRRGRCGDYGPESKRLHPTGSAFDIRPVVRSFAVGILLFAFRK